MSIKVEFSPKSVRSPAKGSAGLKTQAGGCCTTVSTLMEYSDYKGLIKQHIG